MLINRIRLKGNFLEYDQARRNVWCTMLLSYCLIFVPGCVDHHNNKNDKAVTVSIAPLKYLIDEITEGDLEVHVLVPTGVSPETYAPTPGQMAKVARSAAIFSFGLIDFEKELSNRIEAYDMLKVNVSNGIELIGEPTQKAKTHGHHHGVDPHVWMSPKQLLTVTDNVFAAINDMFPDSTRYLEHYQMLRSRISEMDQSIAKRVSESEVRTILIYHPALSYYARDYGLFQVSLEDEGKEPTAAHLSKLMVEIRQHGVPHYIFCQTQTPIEVVENLSMDTGIPTTTIDPMCEDILAEIQRITNRIVE